MSNLKNNRKKTGKSRTLRLEKLSERCLMHADGLDFAYSARDVADYLNPITSRFESLADRYDLESNNVPQLNSNPGADATLFLDFDGNFQADIWTNTRDSYEDIVTPAFDLDGDPKTFSSRERSVISNVFAAVAEDFAPFNINVTTVAPDSFDNQQALRIAIGGHPQDWYTTGLSSNPTGTSSRDSFTNEQPNLAFVFSEAIEPLSVISDDADLALVLANTVSHEAGHSFGLAHHGEYDSDGMFVDSYDNGTADWTPILGSNLVTDRTTWGNGPTNSLTNLQDDLAILASDTNGFGYRSDDHGDTRRDATFIGNNSSSTMFASGIIEQMSDVDFFSFSTSGGQVTIDLNVAEFGANLDARLELWRAPLETSIVGPTGLRQPLSFSGSPFGKFQLVKNVIASSDPSDSLGASIATNLEEGQYFIAVRSHGVYGDLGQYTLSGNLNLASNPRTEIVANRPALQVASSRIWTTWSGVRLGLGANTVATFAGKSRLQSSSLNKPSDFRSIAKSRTAAVDHLMAELGKSSIHSRMSPSLESASSDLAAVFALRRF